MSKELSKDNSTFVKLTQDNREIIAKEIDMDKGWCRIDPTTPYVVDALCSYGFASCLAIIIYSDDHRFISLRHSGIEIDEIDGIYEVIKEEEDLMAKMGNERPLVMSFGFSWDHYNRDVKMEIESNIKSIKEDKSKTTKEIQDCASKVKEDIAVVRKSLEDFLESIKLEFNVQIIPLPKGTILIDRFCQIDTGLEEDFMRNKISLEEEFREYDALPNILSQEDNMSEVSDQDLNLGDIDIDELFPDNSPSNTSVSKTRAGRKYQK